MKGLLKHFGREFWPQWNIWLPFLTVLFLVAHAVCPWLVTCSRAVPGIAQEDVQDMHRSEWWWSPGASGQSCMQKAFLIHSGLKLVFSASVFELLLKNVPGEMSC